jgi:hypothetical protein
MMENDRPTSSKGKLCIAARNLNSLLNLLWHRILGVIKVERVAAAGSVAVMAIEVKGVAGESGIPTLL